MVCPIMSGTIVERRDHVFTTFFSFRAFSPSTFSRRWPSTNGPFFVERAIAYLFLHAAQTAPLGVPHFFKPPHRTGHTVRLRTKRADKTRAQRIRNPFHNDRPAGLAQLVQHRFSGHHGLDDRFHGRLGHRSLDRSLHGTRAVSSGVCGSCSCRSHGYRSPQPVLPSPARTCGSLLFVLPGRSRSGSRPVCEVSAVSHQLLSKT